MDLRSFRHIVTLARHGSFVGAAGELNLTQPALSRSIHALEEEFGVKLIDRHRNGCTVTPAGALLVGASAAILDQAAALRHNMNAYARGGLGHLCFGSAPAPTTLFLADILATAARELKGLTLAAILAPVPDLIAKLRIGAIEFFLCSESQLPRDTGLVIKPLLHIPIAWFVRAGHPLAGRRGLQLEDLADYALASIGSDFGAAREGEPDVLFSRTVTIRCDDYTTLLATVQRCDAFCLAPASAVGDKSGLIRLDLRVGTAPLTASLVIVHRATRALSPMAEALINHIRICSASPNF